VSTRKRDVKDGKAEDLTRQPEQIRAFRDTWEPGIHSYLSYLRDRLTVARDLLTESGSIFVQIGDENVHLVRSVLDEVFGSDEFVSQIAITKSGGGLESASRVPARLDYILWYARSFRSLRYRPLFEERSDLESGGFTNLMLPSGDTRPLTADERRNTSSIPPGSRIFRTESLTKPGPGSRYTIEWSGKSYSAGNRWWGSPKETIEKLLAIGRVRPFGNTLRYIRFVDDFSTNRLSNLWDGLGGASDPIFVVQTNTKILERCILMTSDPGDLVLDPTCGSGTTAYVAEQLGRRWITVDTSRVALALARQRLMAARYPYYVLMDSADGAAREAQLTGVPPTSEVFGEDVRKGFVYKRVPRITLAAIAQNPDVKEGMAAEAIDAAIARHAESELLLDQPYEDRKRVRVSGPFTVEGLSPHRVLEEDLEKEANERSESAAGTFVETVLANLRRAGVQNTKRDERLTFDWLEPYAGEWLHGEGEYTDSEGTVKRVAISIGPEHGTVGPLQVKEAAKEAVRGRGFDILVVCGFAFDARVGETAREFGKLAVLPARMNPDLAMGDELLKKTGAGNLFMVFGEPDLVVKHEDGEVLVEIHGVDVYDPTTGEVRSSSTEDIACWFVDTDYNDESFFVRHAYFTGAGDPYGRLRKALRADIDETAWSTLYSTISRPFEPPSTGKIAVKVINHYGDEVMRVYDVGRE
jgi:adenine-specific DNA-methyltransferase